MPRTLTKGGWHGMRHYLRFFIAALVGHGLLSVLSLAIALFFGCWNHNP